MSETTRIITLQLTAVCKGEQQANMISREETKEAFEQHLIGYDDVQVTVQDFIMDK